MCRLRSESATLFPGISLLSFIGSVSVMKRKFHLRLCFVLGIMWGMVFAAYVNDTVVFCGFDCND